ncbi:hypothetical protein [uncultured Gammaproteobacteria bacterium]|jgi:hypothetical protein|uniref:Uncharacterized protein n=1 Tax=Bathymodiolus thermophilus thioautotrophic gill symbiont TaxID=2360 RepID=A0ABM8M908_9GAMM|nr:hypothetical protein [Bathymodiolus thermophilus thioautotrophic gill symbiont]CAC9488680.1 hypothetical protein [uncultured Gammaproteobacteria bacterium]CAB5505922.1 hypothetical protein AZO1586I_1534 [Bathymodiolus thermophilus thioautotrophic gill symbiont]CAC9496869.1 hypothetical protein [uncultured Gammaproteobacteria bacterium]CAC9505726.1 hypothetical protein [uncultured Gammaproteobacteria bacterium]CAC9506990.1 hypothetical protein [uncultured Gammaproteobacteria bacterium]
MIDIYKHIVNYLDNLVEELNSSNKINTANFFENISSQIRVETPEYTIKELLVQLNHSASISQYANFTFKEDCLFDEVLKEVEKLL